MIVGIVGILCFIISISGFILSWISLRKENIRYLFPTIGAGCERIADSGLYGGLYMGIVYIIN